MLDTSCVKSFSLTKTVLMCKLMCESIANIYYFHCFICIEARETLKEIPGQLVGFMKANNIKPNPPVLRRSETTVYDHSGGCGLIHDLLTMYSWRIITGDLVQLHSAIDSLQEKQQHHA